MSLPVIAFLGIGLVGRPMASRLAQAGFPLRDAIRGAFAGSRVLEVRGQRMLGRDFLPGGQVKTQLKDQRNILAAAAGVAALLALERQNAGKRLGTAPDRLP